MEITVGTPCIIIGAKVQFQLIGLSVVALERVVDGMYVTDDHGDMRQFTHPEKGLVFWRIQHPTINIDPDFKNQCFIREKFLMPIPPLDDESLVKQKEKEIC